MSAFDSMRAHYADKRKAARAWAAQGGKVVGYLCDNVPTELIAAAGFLPLRVSGDPDGDFDAARRKVDRLYPPDVTNRPPFVASMLNRLLDGTYDLLDYLVVPHNRNAVQAIYRELKDATKADPTLRIPTLHYLDKAWARHASAATYNAASVETFATALAEWRGGPIPDGALHTALADGDENRRLLREVLALRTARPSRLSGEDALQIIGSGMFMPTSEHNALLRQFLDDAAALPERPGPRLFLGGSPQDHTRLYAVVEKHGATVVAEDHCWGARVADAPPSTAGDPLTVLAERFHTGPACSIRGTLGETVSACVGRAMRADVDAAIFYVVDQDWSQNWETPSEMRRLQAAGTPCLHLKAQTYAADGAGLDEPIGRFIATLPIASTGAAA